MELFIEDKNEVKVNFKYNQKDYFYKCKKSDKIIDIYNNFIKDIKSDKSELYLLCDGDKIEDYYITLNQLIKSDNEKEKIFLVYDYLNAINTVDSFSSYSINEENNDKKNEDINSKR